MSPTTIAENSFDERLKVLDAALDTYSKSMRLKFDLIKKNNSTAEVDKRLEKLDETIIELRKKLHAQWRESATSVQADITKANGNLEENIRKVETEVKIAQYVVKALGYIDDVLAILAKITAL